MFRYGKKWYNTGMNRMDLEGTSIYPLIQNMENIYRMIAEQQQLWKENGPFSCSHGCGKCCENFEPDILEEEALYLACWLLEHQLEKAQQLMNGTYNAPLGPEKQGCIFYDPETPYHCTVYGGRTLICRLFGFSGDRGKDGNIRWRPCRFYPKDTMPAEYNRQLSQIEMQTLFGAVPPAMDSVMQQVLMMHPGSTQTTPLREAVKRALRSINFLLYLTRGGNSPNSGPSNAA